MEVMGIVWAVVGGLSLVAAIAEIRNRLILKAEAKKAKAEAAAREAAEAARETPWEARNRMRATYRALVENERKSRW